MSDVRAADSATDVKRESVGDRDGDRPGHDKWLSFEVADLPVSDTRVSSCRGRRGLGPPLADRPPPGRRRCQHVGMDGPDGVLAALQRWEGSGGTWRVVLRAPDRLELELLTCDAGEVMQHLTAAPPSPALQRHLAGRDASDE